MSERRKVIGQRRNAIKSDRSRRRLKLESLETRRMLYGVDHDNSEPSPMVMAENVAAILEDSVVGYGLSISMGDTTLPENDFFSLGAGGDARKPADGHRAFTALTRMEQASVSKPITGVALVKLVQNEILAGNLPGAPIGGTVPIKDLVDTALDNLKLVDYLPADWLDLMTDSVAEEVNQISLRDLLKHESGFTKYTISSEGLRQMLQGLSPDDLDESEYSTTNYSFLRTVIPRLWSAVDNDVLDGSAPFASLPAEMQEAVEADWGDNPLWWFIVNDEPHPVFDTADYIHASLFKHFVRTEVLEPSGVLNAGMKDESDTATLVYTFPEASDGLNTDDQTLFAGGRGWRLSAREVQKFFTHMRFNDGILLPEVRELLWEDTDLVFQPYDLEEFGSFLKHNGANHAPSGCSEPDLGEWAGGDPPDSNCFRVNTIAGIFTQHDVAASLVMNSQVGGAAYLSDFPNQDWKPDILANAYKDSFVGFAIDGNSDDNVFELRRKSDDNSMMEVVLDGGVILARDIDRIQWLTLNGLDGNDQFLISDLPESIELTMNGGGDEDDFLLGVFQDDAIQGQNFSEYIFGPITINGGDEADFVHIQDMSTTGAQYTLTENTFSGPWYDRLFQYSGIQTFQIDANDDGNEVQILGTPDNMIVSIDTGVGQDNVVISDVGAAATLNLFTGSDTDTTTVLGSQDGSTIVVENQLLGIGDGSDTLYLGDGVVGVIDGAIEFYGGTQDDQIVVRDALGTAAKQFYFEQIVADRQVLRFETEGAKVFDGLTYENTRFVRVEAGEADDSFSIYSLHRGTDLTAWGGPGNDTFNVTQLKRSFDFVEGKVSLHGESTSADQQYEPQDNDRMNLSDANTSAVEHYIVAPIFGPYNRITRDRFSLIYAGMEISHLNTSNVNSVIDVEGLVPLSGRLSINANLGSDTVRISPTLENQDTIQSRLVVSGGKAEEGTTDHLHVHDRLSDNAEPYYLRSARLWRADSAIVNYTSFDALTWELNDVGNQVKVNSTPNDTYIHVRGGAGGDEMLARLLTTTVLFDAGGGSDTAQYQGTPISDHFDVTADEMRLNKGTLQTVDTELRRVHGARGQNRLTLTGVAGVNEVFHVMPTITAGKGSIEVTGWSPVEYIRTVEHVIHGNPADGDLLHIDGATAASGDQVADVFKINLAGGLGTGPVASLQTASGLERFRLLDYSDIAAAVFDAKGGDDTFNVHVGEGPGRIVALIGGEGMDNLNVQYEQAADYYWESFGQSGSMDFAFDEELFEINYQSMENVADPLPV